MSNFGDLFQSADWKQEKHAPVIEGPDEVKKGETFQLQVSVGKEIPHPNTTEHHIRWIEVYFLADGEKFPIELGRAEFTAHGESTEGPNQGPACTEPGVVLRAQLTKSGTLCATSYCNIHGLWVSQKSIKVSE
ncbi:MAG: superoxide reductase [Candidatus Atribacteria bacterium]|nr:superoxide reductase [Candidatus Atribacteria bacterium]